MGRHLSFIVLFQDMHSTMPPDQTTPGFSCSLLCGHGGRRFRSIGAGRDHLTGITISKIFSWLLVVFPNTRLTFFWGVCLICVTWPLTWFDNDTKSKVFKLQYIIIEHTDICCSQLLKQSWKRDIITSTVWR